MVERSWDSALRARYRSEEEPGNLWSIELDDVANSKVDIEECSLRVFSWKNPSPGISRCYFRLERISPKSWFSIKLTYKATE